MPYGFFEWTQTGFIYIGGFPGDLNCWKICIEGGNVKFYKWVGSAFVDMGSFTSSHGSLSGLGNDDHTQYHNDARGDVRYFPQTNFISTSTGVPDAGKPIVLNGSGQLDPSLGGGVTSHGALTGLNADDHTQYHNDTRGDARYFQQSEFVNATTGVPDAGKPIKLDATGMIDSSMYVSGGGVEASGQTTNATPITLRLASFPVSPHRYMISADIIAVRDDDTEWGIWHLEMIGSSVGMIECSENSTVSEEAGGSGALVPWYCFGGSAGGNLLIYGVGEAGKTINWKMNAKLIYV